MSLKYLLDTNVVSEPLRPLPGSAVLRRLRRHEGEIAIPSVVWHELRFGVERLPASRRREAIETFLEDVVLATIPILDYDRAAAEWHATERVRLAVRGVTRPFADGQIAAIARVHNLTLVTFNETDFHRFRGLRVASWRR
ncbi:MAG TPA: type II toxin-antitoxin system VapC family toxin, partial [Thermoanaerobaculia bacterium]|nr:type II toxin-antitoxin system VapC family toxin [Thermoanaerobaculia bacterium]